ncbi:MAG: hypothetical protein MI862_27555, partial [Desulfobacterales bacterium]|nr:hypothetical protein [Desulfobacterales bacterium]
MTAYTRWESLSSQERFAAPEGDFNKLRIDGALEQTNLEPLLEVLEDWAEQLKHVDIEGVLEVGDKPEPKT